MPDNCPEGFDIPDNGKRLLGFKEGSGISLLLRQWLGSGHKVMEESATQEEIPGGSPSAGPSRSLMSVAGLVAGATLLSKGIGFIRQALIAAVYGSGPEYSAFGVAYILPGFLLILLGGINGPFHSAIVSVLKKQRDRDREDAAAWLESISTLVGCLLLLVSLGLWWGADWVVRLKRL